jgi:Restriction endonuclease S subunits
MEAIGEQGELDASRSRPLGEVLSGYTYVADGDVMLAKITPCFENGKAAVATGLQQGIGFATTEVIPVRPNDPEDAKFFYYLLTSMPFKAVAEGSMYGAGGQKRVADSFVAEYHLAAPPSLERTQIAAFLDHETARIDRLIEKQQRLIELLKEKRQAVISHAVTKGLDPNVPMKDSDVEWLGQVPEHWLETKPRWLFIQAKRQGFPSLEVLSVYREYGVIVKSTRDDNNNKTPDNLNSYQLVNASDLVVNKMKAWQGSLGVSEHEGITSPDYIVYSAKHDESDQFLHYLLRSSSMPNIYRSISNGIRPSQWRLEPEKFEQLPLFLPPKDEQEAIVAFIKAQLLRIERISSKCTGAISLMQERRTALISAAVTGKIDVRNWQPNTNTQAAEPDLPMAAEQATEYRI